jgi:hypothetical protein
MVLELPSDPDYAKQWHLHVLASSVLEAEQKLKAQIRGSFDIRVTP